jgi:succinate dehydrogenase/fumarate reductase flavoprotein subunit
MVEDKKPENKTGGVSRRGFLRGSALAAVGAAAGAGVLSTPQKAEAAVEYNGEVRNIPSEPTAPGQRKQVQTEFKCDVLVIGSGYAGTMAALRAQALGQEVIVVTKQVVGKAGLSPWANTMLFYDESLGDKRADWIKGFQTVGDYLIDLDYLDVFIEDSLARYKQWQELGIVNPYSTLPSPAELVQYSQGKGSPTDRRWVWPSIFKNAGVRVVERTMLTNLLLAKNGSVSGAVGLHVESDEVMIFRSRSVVMCTGSGGFKVGGYPINGSTNDGDWMAYNIGARIGGKEWEDFHGTGGNYPSDSWGQGDERFIGKIYATEPPTSMEQTRAARPSSDSGSEGLGGQVRTRQTIFDMHRDGPSASGARPGGTRGNYVPVDLTEWENVRYDNDNNHAPITWPELPMRTNPEPAESNNVGGGSTGLGIHASEGIFPVDANCWSGIPGLWAAGDALSSRLCGAQYTGKGVSSSSAGVFGYRAGEQAANYAKGISEPSIPTDQIKMASNEVLEPLKRTTGYDPHWLQELVLQTYAPYYMVKMKHEKRLEAALVQAEFMREHIAPKLKAADPHENRLCHEAKHMAFVLEMKLRASLFRKETRGTHVREDYPDMDDKNFLGWSACHKDDSEKMTVSFVPVPERMLKNKS